MVEPSQDSSDPQTAGGLLKNFSIPDIAPEKFRNALVYLLLLGLIVRIGYFVEHSHADSFGVPTLDQTYYDTVARMILAGQDLHQLHGFRPLLYPMFLAAIYKVGGTAGVPLAIVVQHLMGIATGFLVALLGARIFRNRLCGLVGGGLFMLAPVPLYFEGELLIESSYIFLIFVALLVHFQALEKTGWKAVLLWGCGGALMELAAQARANILIFLGVYPLFALWCWWRTRKLAAFLPMLGLVGALAMMIPWGYVNLVQSDAPQFIPSQGGVNLYLGNKHTADGMIPEQERPTSYDQRYQDSVEMWGQQEYERAMRAEGREPSADPGAVSHYWTQRALAEIKAHPLGWLHLMAKKTWLMAWNAEVPNNKSFAFLQAEFPWLHWLPVRWVVLFALAPLGIWLGWKRGNVNAVFILMAYVILYSAGNIAFFVCDRYRYPIYPATAVFAGGGLMYLVATIRNRQSTAIVGALGIVALMTALSLPNWFNAKLPTYARDYFFRSLAEYDKGHFDPALADINASVQLDPHDANAVMHRGNVLFAMGRLAEAKQAYEQVLAINPAEPGAWTNLGDVLDATGQPDEALRAFKRAIACVPPSRNAFLGIAYIQIRRRQFEDATKTLDELKQVTGNEGILALAVRAVIEQRQENIQTANELEQQVKRKDPDAIPWVLKHVDIAAPKTPHN